MRQARPAHSTIPVQQWSYLVESSLLAASFFSVLGYVQNATARDCPCRPRASQRAEIHIIVYFQPFHPGDVISRHSSVYFVWVGARVSDGVSSIHGEIRNVGNPQSVGKGWGGVRVRITSGVGLVWANVRRFKLTCRDLHSLCAGRSCTQGGPNLAGFRGVHVAYRLWPWLAWSCSRWKFD